MIAVRAVGVYAPRFRIDAEAIADAWGQFEAAGIDETSVPAADEDALTMGLEAATRALGAADLAGEDVDWLGFATSTPPLAEEDLTARLGAMLGVDSAATRHPFTGSTRAGTRALWAATDALESGRGASEADGVAFEGPTDGERALVVAADAPRGEPGDELEHAAGAGAAAFVLGVDGPIALVDRGEYAAPYPGTRFREAGDETTEGLGIRAYDRQAFAETIGGAVDALETDSELFAVDAAAIQAPDGKLPYRAADAVGVDPDAIRECAIVHELGDLGAASVPVALARALSDDHDSVLAVSHGSGAGADALLLESRDDATSGVPARLALEGAATVSYAEYLRQRGVVTSGPPEGGGAYVSVPSWQRSLPQRYRLETGRCPDCDALAFPPEGACPHCGSLAAFDPVELTGQGTVEAVTTVARGGAPPEFTPLQDRAGEYAVAIVALEGPRGGTASAPAMATDCDPETLAVGDRVETTIRRIYTQEGVTRYGFKVRPI